MKYSVDTYRLYQSEKYFAHSVRIHVRMKDEVDINVLDKAVNLAIRRYPYFAVRVTVDEDGGYILVPNDRKIVVMPTAEKMPMLGSSKNTTWSLMHRRSENRTVTFFRERLMNLKWIC